MRRRPPFFFFPRTFSQTHTHKHNRSVWWGIFSKEIILLERQVTKRRLNGTGKPPNSQSPRQLLWCVVPSWRKTTLPAPLRGRLFSRFSSPIETVLLGWWVSVASVGLLFVCVCVSTEFWIGRNTISLFNACFYLPVAVVITLCGGARCENICPSQCVRHRSFG